MFDMYDYDYNCAKSRVLVIATIITVLSTLSFIPIGCMFINDMTTQLKEYETVLEENKETLNEYYEDNYKVYLKGVKLSDDQYNSILENLENYHVLIDELNKTILLTER